MSLLVTGALSHSVPMKIKRLSFEVGLNEHINSLQHIWRHCQRFREEFVLHRQTRARSHTQKTTAPTSGMSLKSPSKSPRLSVLEVITIDPILKRALSNRVYCSKAEALLLHGG